MNADWVSEEKKDNFHMIANIPSSEKKMKSIEFLKMKKPYLNEKWLSCYNRFNRFYLNI